MGVVVVSTLGVAGVPCAGVDDVADTVGRKVGVGVNVRVGSWVGVGDAVAVLLGSGLGRTRGASDVGVGYVPHREGVFPHDVSNRAAMQNTTKERVTGHPSSELYPGSQALRCAATGH